MTSLRSILTHNEDGEEFWVKSRVHFIPVEFELPELVKEALPLLTVKAIEGNKILRFYTPPQRGDLIEWQGYEWEVTGYRHQPLKKGSRGQDILPTLLTKYVDRIE